jgi:hypothetical protein
VGEGGHAVPEKRDPLRHETQNNTKRYWMHPVLGSDEGNGQSLGPVYMTSSVLSR